MDTIRSKWRLITLLLVISSYANFMIYMDHRTDLLYMTFAIYSIITIVLFFSTFVGFPGLVLHTIFKREDLAIPFYQKAIALKTKNTNILIAYGLILLRRYEPEAAMKLFEKGLALSSHFYYKKALTGNLALCQWKAGHLEEALATYEDMLYYPDLEKITDFSKNNIQEGADINFNFTATDFTTLGYLYFINNRMDEAKYFSWVALEKASNYAPAYDNLGQIEYHNGHLEEAEELFKNAITFNPAMNDSLYYLAKINLELSRTENAREYFKKINLKEINGLSTVTLDMVEQLKTAL